MTDLDRACLEAIRHLEAAKALLADVKKTVHAACIDIHWIDVARKHVHATRGDLKREGL